MFGSLGVPELLLIFVIILIVFGPRRIPEVGRTLGKALGEFRKATDDLKSSIEREVRLEELKKITPAALAPFDAISRTEPVTAPAPPPPADAPADPAQAFPTAPSDDLTPPPQPDSLTPEDSTPPAGPSRQGAE